MTNRNLDGGVVKNQVDEIVRQLGKLQKEIDHLKRQEHGVNGDALKVEILAAQEARLTEFEAEIAGLTTVVNQYISIFNQIVGGSGFVLPDEVILDSTG